LLLAKLCFQLADVSLCNWKSQGAISLFLNSLSAADVELLFIAIYDIA